MAAQIKDTHSPYDDWDPIDPVSGEKVDFTDPKYNGKTD